MRRTLIQNAKIVNEGSVFVGSVLIDGDIIADIIPFGESLPTYDYNTVEAHGMYLFPGIIDDHVHFREPGLTHKANMASESAAAAAGGVTTVFDMPNTLPTTTSIKDLQEKYRIAAKECLVNHSFYFGATSDNLHIIENIDPVSVCGIKVFMGSSTGNMLLDNRESLLRLFKISPVLIAAHCEDSSIINSNLAKYTESCQGEPDITYHPLIRSTEACYRSSAFAIELAHQTGARLHILHISTAKELELLQDKPSNVKLVTAEVCPAHLMFHQGYYKTLGARIKCNPAIKTTEDREALREALKSYKIDVVGTDHAPHLLNEKKGGSVSAASGMPILPYSLPALLELSNKGFISLPGIAQKMCHNPAIIFNIEKRGFIRKGYKADFALVSETGQGKVVKPSTLPSLCGWSPFEGIEFKWSVKQTWINGNKIYEDGRFFKEHKGDIVTFVR